MNAPYRSALADALTSIGQNAPLLLRQRQLDYRTQQQQEIENKQKADALASQLKTASLAQQQTELENAEKKRKEEEHAQALSAIAGLNRDLAEGQRVDPALAPEIGPTPEADTSTITPYTPEYASKLGKLAGDYQAAPTETVRSRLGGLVGTDAGKEYLGGVEKEELRQDQIDANKAMREATFANQKTLQDERLEAEAKRQKEHDELLRYLASLKDNKNDDKTDFTQERQLRQELQARSKQYLDIRDSYGRILEAAKDNTPMANISMVYQYMKMLDPGSVVREGEYATAQNAAGVPDRIRNAYNKAIKGNGLNADQVKDMVNQAGRIYSSHEKTQKALLEEYANNARSYKLDPDRVTKGFLVDFNQGTSGSGSDSADKQKTLRSKYNY